MRLVAPQHPTKRAKACRWNLSDPQLAYPLISRQRWSDDEDEVEDEIKARIATELAERIDES